MKVTVHDVGHGLCVSLIHENGNVMLWDCGHSRTNRPSEFLRREGIHKINRLTITNYDEDHINDLPNLYKTMSIYTLVRNTSINASQLSQLKLKSGPISPAMRVLLGKIAKNNLSFVDFFLLLWPKFGFGPISRSMISLTDMTEEYNQSTADIFLFLTFPGVECKTFWNNYGTEFNDTNNISLVTFLHCRGTCFLIPGDVETAGWRSLLRKSGFKDELTKVDYFIASHHGRKSGYCAEVFNYCKPKAVIFSDGPIKYVTQGMATTYHRHASGCKFKGRTRHVLSTRKDKDIRWTIPYNWTMPYSWAIPYNG